MFHKVVKPMFSAVLILLVGAPVCKCYSGQDGQALMVKSDGHFLRVQPDVGAFKDPAGGFNAQEAASYWGKNLNASKEVSHCIADAIVKLANVEGYRSVSDYGAGLGGFGLYLKQKGIPEVHCYDANPMVEKTSKGLCQTADLGKMQPSLPKVDVAMTLEVGEHIPKEFEQAFLDNLASAGTKAIVVSWAHPGQGGTRHVNEQPQGYIADQIRQRGYELDRSWTAAMRTASRGCPPLWYFMMNTMVFKKRESRDGYWYETWSDWYWLNKRELFDLSWLVKFETEGQIRSMSNHFLFPLALACLAAVVFGFVLSRTRSSGSK